MNTLRNYLVAARDRAAMTPQDVAQRLGISVLYYQQIENGERQLHLDPSLVGGLSAALNIPVLEIVHHEMRMHSAR